MQKNIISYIICPSNSPLDRVSLETLSQETKVVGELTDQLKVNKDAL
jgi:hypothetical protein